MNQTLKTLMIMATVAFAVVLVLDYIRKQEVVVATVKGSDGKDTQVYTIKKHWFKIKA